VKTKRQSNKKTHHRKEKPSTQLDKVNQALIAIAKDVTATDRKEAPASEPTVIDYLKGKGKDLETGLKLLRFFRPRIELREKEISGAS
jgi:hypothetical protein